jgi:hypothetical protein
MRGDLMSAAALLLAGALIPVAATAAPAAGARVSLTACPYEGITAPCLMIKGPDGTVYNITAAKPPFNGRMIRLRGTVTDRLSACTQGIVLDRVRWTPVRQKCPS